MKLYFSFLPAEFLLNYFDNFTQNNNNYGFFFESGHKLYSRKRKKATKCFRINFNRVERKKSI